MRLKVGHLNLFVTLFFSLFNSITLVIEKRPFEQYLLYVLPFIIVGAGYYFIERKCNSIRVNAFLFALFGVFTTLTGQQGNATGVIFICYSLFLFNTVKVNIVLIGVTLITFVFKFFLVDLTVMQTLNMILIYAYVIAIYYLLFHPKKIKILEIPGVDFETLKILGYIAQGCKYKEISDKGDIYLSVEAIRQRVGRVKKNMNCSSNMQLIIELYEKGYFQSNCDKDTYT